MSQRLCETTVIVLGRELRASSVSKARSVTEGLRERREATIQAGTTFTAPVDIHSQPIRLNLVLLSTTREGRSSDVGRTEWKPVPRGSVHIVLFSHPLHSKVHALGLARHIHESAVTCQDRVSTQ